MENKNSNRRLPFLHVGSSLVTIKSHSDEAFLHLNPFIMKTPIRAVLVLFLGLTAIMLMPTYSWAATLTAPEPPKRGHQVILERLAATLESEELSGIDTIDVSLRYPHQAYSGRLDDLAAGRLLDAAKPTAWRYLITSPHSTAVAEATLVETGAGSGLRCSYIEVGPRASGSLQAIRAAETHLPLGASTYEVRFLQVPAVNLAAIWLKSDKGDVIIPVGRAPGDLILDVPYSELEILNAMRPIAQSIIEFERRNAR